jgi:DNA polymerase III epsilon subunit-like protein
MGNMTYIALDTETTGLPSKRTKDFTQLDVFENCRVVSVAVVLYDENDTELANFHDLIKPEGYTEMPEGSFKVHGISYEKAQTEGKPFSEVWKKIEALFLARPNIVGHNVGFDTTALLSEAHRRGFNTGCAKGFKEICTQRMAKKIYQQNFRLGELYKKLVGKDLEGWHGALADTRAAAEVYAIMKKYEKPSAKEISAKKIILKASEVAACIGKHQYKKPQEVADEIWKKYCPETFTGITKNDKAKESIASSPEAENALREAMESVAEKSDDTTKIVRAAEAKINSNDTLTPTQKREVNEYIRSKVFTNFGTKSEDKTSDKVEAAEGTTLIRDDNFYSLEVTTICGTRYVIVGKIDRVEIQPDGTKVLVEIKNRARGLFNAMRPYEMIQVQTYLQMVGMDTARLIEQYNNETASHHIVKDQQMWDTVVMPRLVEFCNDIHARMSN